MCHIERERVNQISRISESFKQFVILIDEKIGSENEQDDEFLSHHSEATTNMKNEV